MDNKNYKNTKDTTNQENIGYCGQGCGVQTPRPCCFWGEFRASGHGLLLAAAADIQR